MQVLHPAVCGPPITPSSGCSCRLQQKQQQQQHYHSGTNNLLPATAASTSACLYQGGHLGLFYGRCACVAGNMCSDSGGIGTLGRVEPGARQTSSHLFEDGDRVGTGGSCDVYCGVEKGTGRRHALKVLRVESPEQRLQLQQEVDTLAKLSSAKVVAFLGHSLQVDTGRPVLVLEYCNGGSLLTFLQQPEHTRGLDDDDLRTLLGDLVEGLTYLRAKGIVHRDIKPGNILRHVHDSGKCEYKLSDFGTSREAADTEQTTSIVGTEEYLHPVLYKNAFFGNLTHSNLSPLSGELWSLGCTLYQASTASLPFRPLGGSRRNRKAMFVMISQKPPGAISGDQRLDGTFRWSKTLPSDCRMSENLREKVTPLLQNLLETDRRRQWNFTTFLDESKRVLGMRCIHVFDTECGELFRLYMESKQSLAELQDALAYHTEVAAGHQLLFHRVQPLLSMLTSRAMIGDLPVTHDDQPLLLLSPNAAEGRCRRQVPEQPDLLLSEATLEEDISSSFRLCTVLYVHYLMALAFQRLPNLLFSALLAIKSALTSSQSTVETRFRVLSATCQERQSRLSILSQMLDILHGPAASDVHGMSKLDQAKQLCDQLRDKLWQLKYELDEARKGSDAMARLDGGLLDARSSDDSADAIQHLFTCSKDTWRRMQDRRQKVPLSELEQTKHKGDRASLNRLSMDSVRRVKAMQTKRSHLLKQFTSQVRQWHEKLEAMQNIDNQLQSLKAVSEQFSTLLDQIWKAGSEDLRKLVEVKHSVSPPPSIPPQIDHSSRLGELLSEGLPALETFHLNPSDVPK